MAFVPRLTAEGMIGNPWYYTNNRYYRYGAGLPNCTAFSYGRWGELTLSEPTYLPQDDAGKWWNYPISGIQRGQVPQLGAILCMYDPYGYYKGHVCTVEQILPNGNIITGNSAKNGDYFFTETNPVADDYIPGWAKNRGYRKQGFLYLPGLQPQEWIYGNRLLNIDERENNAFLTYYYLLNKGWTLEAIAGILGNFDLDSSINPAYWEDTVIAIANGYGLSQWKPSTDFTTYANQQGWALDDGYKQLDFIDLDPTLLYIPTQAYSETLAQYKVLTQSAEYCATVWFNNYKRTGIASVDDRKRRARYYYELLKGDNPPFNPGSDIVGLKVWQMIKYRI